MYNALIFRSSILKILAKLFKIIISNPFPSSETQGFKGEGDGKETGSEKNEEKEGGGAGKGKEEGEALGIFSTKSFSQPFAFLSCYWPHF